MAQTNKYLDGFHKWWTNQGHSIRSADGYRSGIRRVNDEFFIPTVHKDMFSVLDDAISSGSAVDWLTALIGIISARIEQTDGVSIKKRLQDNRCQLKRFTEYISELQDFMINSGFDDIEIQPELLPDGKHYYSHDKVLSHFARRLSLEDYMKGDAEIFLPMRIVGRLFMKSANKNSLLQSLGILDAPSTPADLYGWYRNWIEERADRVKFYSSQGDYELSAVDGVLIDSKRHRAWIRVNGKDYALLTYNKDACLQELNVNSLREIRVISSEPVETVLSRIAPVLIILRQITDDIKATFNGKTIHLKKFDFNMEGGKYYTVDIKLDDYLPLNRHEAVVWYCENVDWTKMAPLLSLVRTELTYIASATRLIAS